MSDSEHIVLDAVISVSIAQMAGDTQRVDLPLGSKVSDALALAHIEPGRGHVVTMNGNTVDLDDELVDSATLVVVGKVNNG